MTDTAKAEVMNVALASGWHLRHDFVTSVELRRGTDDLFVQFTRHGLQVSSAISYSEALGDDRRIAPRSANKRNRLIALLWQKPA